MSETPIEVVVLPPFEKALKKLKKRFPRVLEMVFTVVEQLQNGLVLGDKIPNLAKDVYKVRVANPDGKKGKSSGFRIIYYVRQADLIWLLTIYSKTDQSDIPVELIAEWLLEYEIPDSNEEPEE